MILQCDRTLIRSTGNSRRYVLAAFTAPDSPRALSRQPINVAFVLDRSGSMGGSKIELARKALVQALRMLRPTDRFSVVFYDDQIDLLVPSTMASEEAISNAVRQVERIQARGNTNLGGGWLKGCEQIAEHLQHGQIGKCLLLTDGLANEGITDESELEHHGRELRSRGVATSTFGVGQDFNESLLTRLADAGGGRSYYIETPVQIADNLTSELGEMLETVVRGAAIRVRTEPGVDVRPLNPFEYRRIDDRVTEIRLGDLVSRQLVSLVIRFQFPAGQEGVSMPAVFTLADSAGVLSTTASDVVWTYSGDAANDTQRRNVVVDREVARLYAARAREQALEMNRAGRYDDAQRVLREAAARIREYAHGDSMIEQTISELEDRYGTYAVALGAPVSKSEHYLSYNLSRMRDSTGRAKRRPDGA